MNMAGKPKQTIPNERITQTIIPLRGQKVMLDSDLAELYGVTTRRLNDKSGAMPTVSRGFRVLNNETGACRLDVAKRDFKWLC